MATDDPADIAAAAAVRTDGPAPEGAASAGGEGGYPEAMEEEPPKFDVHYSCLRCGTNVSSVELGRLPEIKCICGYKVFTKVRPPLAKTVQAV